jgi:catechol 2,3-dioxygenase-like lactoylglutathione lyase family enzyme
LASGILALRFGLYPSLKEGDKKMFKRIDHVEIIPRDVDQTIDFYVNILGFTVKSRQDMDRPPMKEIVYLELGDTVIELIGVENPPPKSEEPWQIQYRGIALEVEDMEKAVEHLKSQGVEITVPPVDLGKSLRGEIRDPDGLLIELRHWK